MRKIFSIVIVFLLSLASFNASAEDLRRYPVKSAIVEYEVTGSQSGKETLYFDDFGSREVRYSEYSVKILGFESETRTMTVIDGDWVYNIDLTERQGTRMNIAKARDMAVKGMQNQALMDYSRKMVENMGGVKEGTGEVLGKECQIYAFPKMNMKVWIYKRMALKSTVSTTGVNMDIVATSIKENVDIPPTKFKVPEDVVITDMSEELSAMQQSILESFGQ